MVDPRKMTNRQKVLAAIAHNRFGTTREIAEAIGKRPSYVQQIVNRLRRAGLIKKIWVVEKD